MVRLVENMCSWLGSLGKRKVRVGLDCRVGSVEMWFDGDKVGKMVNKVVRNGYKFRGDGGFMRVCVSVGVGEGVGEKDWDMVGM